MYQWYQPPARSSRSENSAGSFLETEGVFICLSQFPHHLIFTLCLLHAIEKNLRCSENVRVYDIEWLWNPVTMTVSLKNRMWRCVSIPQHDCGPCSTQFQFVFVTLQSFTICIFRAVKATQVPFLEWSSTTPTSSSLLRFSLWKVFSPKAWSVKNCQETDFLCCSHRYHSTLLLDTKRIGQWALMIHIHLKLICHFIIYC